MIPPAILVLTGASGAGKSTLRAALETMRLPGAACFNCDTIYQDLPAGIRADGLLAQDAILSHWVNHVLQTDLRIAVLDTQIRPHRAIALLSRLGITISQIVLVECEQQERENRLRGPRAQAELISPQMENWAAYLRGQADVLQIPIINTSGVSLETSAAQLLALVNELTGKVES